MKRLVGVAALLLALVAVALVATPLVVSAEVVKRRVAEQITAWTGREVRFDADPKISFTPYLRFSFGRTVIGGGPDTEGDAFVEMDGLRGGLRLMPLLFGRIEPTEFELVAPRIRLAVDAAGRPNWLMPNIAAAGRRAEAARRPPAGAPREPEPPPDVRLGRFTVTRGTVQFADSRTGRSFTLDKLDLKADWPSITAAAVATATFSWHGEPIEANLSVADPVDLIGGTGSPVRLALASSLLRVALNGAAHQGAEFQLEGEATVTTPSLRRVAEWAGRAVGPGPTLGAAQIKGKVNWIGPSIGFSDAALELDGNKAVGVLKLLLDGPRPKLVGTLALETLDLTAYAEGFRAASARAGAPAASWQETPIEARALGEADFDLRVSAGQVVLGGAKMTRAAASAVVENGKLVFNLGEARAYGGRLAGSITAELAAKGLKAGVQANFDHIEIRPVLTEAAGIDGMSGAASGALEVSGSGTSWGTLAGSLSGSATLKLAACSLPGLDLARLSTILLDPASGASFAAADAATTFDTVEAKLVFGGGSMQTEGLIAKAKAYGVSLDGKASLTAPTITGHGVLSIAKPSRAFRGSGGAPVDVPFVVGGTWRQPTLSPDVERLIKRSAADRDSTLAADHDELPQLSPPLAR